MRFVQNFTQNLTSDVDVVFCQGGSCLFCCLGVIEIVAKIVRWAVVSIDVYINVVVFMSLLFCCLCCH